MSFGKQFQCITIADRETSSFIYLSVNFRDCEGTYILKSFDYSPSKIKYSFILLKDYQRVELIVIVKD